MKLLVSAILGWLIAFILGNAIAGDFLTGGGMLYGGEKHRTAFWLFMSLAPGTLGGIITIYIYERLKNK